MEIKSLQTYSNRCHNAEVLKEYFSLQKELVTSTFGEGVGKKRIMDVADYLAQENLKRGGVANSQVERFVSECAVVSNTIAATLSGCKGERKAFKSLETINAKYIMLRNVELEFNGHKTELDAVLLTKRGAIIIEVKNTSRNVIITSSGNLNRQCVDGKYKTDCHLGLKMNDKEYVLRQALDRSDYKNVPIRSVVVFTNSDIEIDNQNHYIKVCSLSELPHVVKNIINYEKGNYCIEELKNMELAINKSRASFNYSDAKELAKIKTHYEEIRLLISATPEKKSFFERIKNLFGFGRKRVAVAS